VATGCIIADKKAGPVGWQCSMGVVTLTTTSVKTKMLSWKGLAPASSHGATILAFDTDPNYL
jgi:hypothetical protein